MLPDRNYLTNQQSGQAGAGGNPIGRDSDRLAGPPFFVCRSCAANVVTFDYRGRHCRTESFHHIEKRLCEYRKILKKSAKTWNCSALQNQVWCRHSHVVAVPSSSARGAPASCPGSIRAEVLAVTTARICLKIELNREAEGARRAGKQVAAQRLRDVAPVKTVQQVIDVQAQGSTGSADLGPVARTDIQ